MAIKLKFQKQNKTKSYSYKYHLPNIYYSMWNGHFCWIWNKYSVIVKMSAMIPGVVENYELVRYMYWNHTVFDHFGPHKVLL